MLGPMLQEVRRLTPADAAAYRALRLESLQAAPKAFGAAFDEEAGKPLDWFAATLSTAAVFGISTGIAGFRRETAAKRRHIGWVWGVYLRPEARRQGHARRLLQAVIDHARGEVERLRLDVGTDNAPALALYQALGFSIIGTEPAALRVAGQDHDEHMMTLDLRSPP